MEACTTARITAYFEAEDWSADGESDEFGRFEFPDVPEGRLNVRAEANGHESKELQWFARSNAQYPLTLRLFLPRDGVYSGRVVDEAGKPIAGARVWVMPEGSSVKRIMPGTPMATPFSTRAAPSS